MKAVFLDREGTLIVEPYDQVLDRPEKIYLFDDTLEALSALSKLDYSVFLLINENGLAQKRITKEQFEAINAQVLEKLGPSGITIEHVYYCPHASNEECECRKPKPGMIRQAMESYPVDIAESFVIGDKLQDVGLGKAVGAQTILIDREGRFTEGTADYIVSGLAEAVGVLGGPMSGLQFDNFSS